MHGIRVGGGMDRDGADAHFPAGAMDAQGNFAAIGDQHLLEHGGRSLQRHSMIASGSPNSTG
ncbi:hypothetical protein ACFQ4K_05210 [Tistrella bauzanensis]